MHQTAFPMQGVCTADGPWLYQARLSSFWHASNSILSRAKVYYRPGHGLSHGATPTAQADIRTLDDHD
jgi:hypothetical protein